MLKLQREIMIKRYARQFCDQVRADFPILSLTDKNPKIKCFTLPGGTDAPTDAMEGITYTENGIYYLDGFFDHDRNIVEIYSITTTPPEELRETVRHECLHYLLFNSGHPHRDSDKLFLFLAANYKAAPYYLINHPETWNEILNESDPTKARGSGTGTEGQATATAAER